MSSDGIIQTEQVVTESMLEGSTPVVDKSDVRAFLLANSGNVSSRVVVTDDSAVLSFYVGTATKKVELIYITVPLTNLVITEQ